MRVYRENTNKYCLVVISSGNLLVPGTFDSIRTTEEIQ